MHVLLRLLQVRAAGSLAVGADAEETAAVIDPIARYEFLDAENPGKDSMGNYDLALRDADGQSNGTVAVAEGVATFNGTRPDLSQPMIFPRT